MNKYQYVGTVRPPGGHLASKDGVFHAKNMDAAVKTAKLLASHEGKFPLLYLCVSEVGTCNRKVIECKTGISIPKKPESSSEGMGFLVPVEKKPTTPAPSSCPRPASAHAPPASRSLYVPDPDECQPLGGAVWTEWPATPRKNFPIISPKSDTELNLKK